MKALDAPAELLRSLLRDGVRLGVLDTDEVPAVGPRRVSNHRANSGIDHTCE